MTSEETMKSRKTIMIRDVICIREQMRNRGYFPFLKPKNRQVEPQDEGEAVRRAAASCSLIAQQREAVDSSISLYAS